MPQSRQITVRKYDESHPVTGVLYSRVQVSWSDSKGVNLDTPTNYNGWQQVVMDNVQAMLRSL